MNLKAPTRIAAYLLVYLGVPLVALIVPNETVSSVLGIIYILLLIPFGILRMIDFYRTNDGTTLISRIFNVLFRVPLVLFGLVCMVAGVAIVGWVLYNVFVERQEEYSGPSFVAGLGSFGVAVPLALFGWFTLRSVVRRREQVALSPEEQEDFEHEEDDEERAAKDGQRSNFSLQTSGMDKFIHIRSPRFPILPGEKEELVNEGMYGKAVAEYLQAKLRERGYAAPFFCCEDWGWWVELKNAPFGFGVCIYSGPERDGLLDFFCTVGVHGRRKWSWRKFRFMDTGPWVKKLHADLVAIFRADPEVQVISTDLDSPFA